MRRTKVSYRREIIENAETRRTAKEFAVCVILAMSACGLQKVSGKSNDEVVGVIAPFAVVIVEIILFGYLRERIKKLEKERFIPYMYFSKKYGVELEINPFILLASTVFLVIILLVWRKQAAGPVVVLFFWLYEFWRKLRNLSKLYNCQDTDKETERSFAELTVNNQKEELALLLINGIVRGQQKAEVIRLFARLFNCHIVAKVMEEVSGIDKEMNQKYRKAYDIIDSYISEYKKIFNNADSFGEFLIEWVLQMLIVDEQQRYYKLIEEAVVISYINFEKNCDIQNKAYSEIDGRLSQDNVEDANIFLLNAEFCYQYQKYGKGIRLEVPEKIFNFMKREIHIRTRADADFMRLLWYIWTKKEKLNLSDSICSFEELLKYVQRGSTDFQLVSYYSRSKSLYMMIRYMNI